MSLTLSHYLVYFLGKYCVLLLIVIVGRPFSRKRDCVALVSPLLFTPGAMTWNISIIMRHWKVSHVTLM